MFLLFIEMTKQNEKLIMFFFCIGFTPLYRMCVAYKSCTLVYDSGLRSAFIIAHEIAHRYSVCGNLLKLLLSSRMLAWITKLLFYRTKLKIHNLP